MKHTKIVLSGFKIIEEAVFDNRSLSNIAHKKT